MYMIAPGVGVSNRKLAGLTPMRARRRRTLMGPYGSGFSTSVPSSPGPQPEAPAPELLTNVPQGQISQDPLDYISPQAAIAAGLDPQGVYGAWTVALGKFPTAQDALAAGIPAGVVTQLWAESRAYAITQPDGGSWLDAAPLGVANKYLLGILGGVLGLSLLAGRRGRR